LSTEEGGVRVRALDGSETEGMVFDGSETDKPGRIVRADGYSRANDP